MDDTALELSYEEDYRIEDPAFPGAFVVKRAVNNGRPAWWNGPDGRSKTERLINAFKMDFTVHEACIFAGITLEQYKRFCEIHPDFVGCKSRLKGILAIAAKQGLVNDVAHPSGFRSRQWYLERKQPKIYGRAPELILPPETTSVTTVLQRAFADDDGNVLVTETTAHQIKRHEDDQREDS